MERLYNMDGSPVNRPKTTQAVIDGFARLLDAQDDKGIKKYGTTIDEAIDENYDWRLMAMEELADFSKYQVKEIMKLEKIINELTEELEKRGHANSENCDLRVKIEDLKITNEKLTNRANSWERVANGNYKAVVKVEKERDEFKRQYIKAHAKIQDLQYKLKVAENEKETAKLKIGEKNKHITELTQIRADLEQQIFDLKNEKSHDCFKNQQIKWDDIYKPTNIKAVTCRVCNKILFGELVQKDES